MFGTFITHGLKNLRDSSCDQLLVTTVLLILLLISLWYKSKEIKS